MELKNDLKGRKYYDWMHGILRTKNKIVVLNIVSLKDSILEWLHGSGRGGHSGRDVTLQRVRSVLLERNG